jgi:nucleotide-binding universal stress UspA family protein
MLSIDHILIPVDFSERSIGAARYARLLACHFRSEVTLLHVLEPPAYELGPMELGGIIDSDLSRVRERAAEEQLRTFLAEEFGPLSARRLVHAGDPAQNIVQMAHAEAVGLIVMPTHGYGPIRRSVLGSVAAKVLHDVTCPVFAGVHFDDFFTLPAPAFRSVLCAVDLGSQSLEVVRWADQFATSFGIGLTVMHATPALAPLGAYVNPEWKTRLEQQTGERLERLLTDAGVTAEILISNDGEASKAVCDVAERLHSSLLVIGRGSASGASEHLRAHAYSIIRHSPCPVVSI